LDLDDATLVTLLGLPRPLLQAAEHDHPIALGEAVAGVFSQLPPAGHPVERRVAVPPAVAVYTGEPGRATLPSIARSSGFQ
jgi:hypothetical protein